MEKKTGLSLYASTTSRSCIVDGYRLFASNFISLVKSSWLPALLFGICCAIVGVINVIYIPRTIALEITYGMPPEAVIASQPDIFLLFAATLLIGALIEIWLYSHSVSQLRSFAHTDTIDRPTRWFTFDRPSLWKTIKATFFMLIIGFIALMIIGVGAVALNGDKGTDFSAATNTTKAFIVIITILVALFLVPMVATTMGYLIKDGDGFFKHTIKRYGIAAKHYSRLFSVVIGGGIITIAIMSLLLLPVIILSTANMQANLGFANGDPLDMPSYMPVLAAIVFFIFGILKSYLGMSLLYPCAFVSGNIDKSEMERQEANLEAGIHIDTTKQAIHY